MATLSEGVKEKFLLWLKPDVGLLKSDETAAGNGDTVHTWQDQSGNGHHVTFTGEPTLNTSLEASQPGLVCDGNQYGSIAYSAALNPSSDITVWWVAKYTGTGTRVLLDNRYLSADGADENRGWTNYVTSGTVVWFFDLYGASSTGVTSVSNAAYIANALNVSSCICDYSGDQGRAYTNGALVRTAGINGSGVSQNNGRQLDVFQSKAGASRWIGNCHEIVIFSGVPSTLERQEVEDYLADKYLSNPGAVGSEGAFVSAAIHARGRKATLTFGVPGGTETWDNYFFRDVSALPSFTVTRPTPAGGTDVVSIACKGVSSTVVNGSSQLEVEVYLDGIVYESDTLTVTGDAALIIDAQGDYTEAMSAEEVTNSSGIPYGKPIVRFAFADIDGTDCMDRDFISGTTLSVYLYAAHWSGLSALDVTITDSEAAGSTDNLTPGTWTLVDSPAELVALGLPAKCPLYKAQFTLTSLADGLLTITAEATPTIGEATDVRNTNTDRSAADDLLLYKGSAGTTYYVNPSTGSDASAGTSTGAAFATVAKAISVASGGDIVKVASSLTHADLGSPVNNTNTGNIVIQPYDGLDKDDVTISFTGSSFRVKYAKFKNLTLDVRYENSIAPLTGAMCFQDSKITCGLGQHPDNTGLYLSNAAWTASTKTIAQSGKFSAVEVGDTIYVYSATAGGMQLTVASLVDSDSVVVSEEYHGSDIESGITSTPWTDWLYEVSAYKLLNCVLQELPFRVVSSGVCRNVVIDSVSGDAITGDATFNASVSDLAKAERSDFHLNVQQVLSTGSASADVNMVHHNIICLDGPNAHILFSGNHLTNAAFTNIVGIPLSASTPLSEFAHGSTNPVFEHILFGNITTIQKMSFYDVDHDTQHKGVYLQNVIAGSFTFQADECFSVESCIAIAGANSSIYDSGDGIHAGTAAFVDGSESGYDAESNSYRPSSSTDVFDSVESPWVSYTLDGSEITDGVSYIGAYGGISSPTVTTTAASSVGNDSAVLGGEVTDDGGDTVTERGIVWNTTGAPTTADNKVAMGSGTGSFSDTVTDLPAGTTIYYNAYATNSVGTSYGTADDFTTIAGDPYTTPAGTIAADGETLTLTWTRAGGWPVDMTGYATAACTVTAGGRTILATTGADASVNGETLSVERTLASVVYAGETCTVEVEEGQAYSEADSETIRTAEIPEGSALTNNSADNFGVHGVPAQGTTGVYGFHGANEN